MRLLHQVAFDKQARTSEVWIQAANPVGATFDGVDSFGATDLTVCVAW